MSDSDRWLLLDIGNSETVAGVSDGQHIQLRVRYRTNAEVTADEYRSLLASLLDSAPGAGSAPRLEQVSRVIASSVVPAVERLVCNAFAGKPLLQIDHHARREFQLDLPFPEQLGADRLANVAGALTTSPPPFIIVDAGTATTICLVDKRPAYIGGAIAPGLLISWRALLERAAKLTAVPLAHPPSAVGVTTEAQLQSGLLLGHEALVSGLIEALRRDAGTGFADARVLATGGCASLLRLPDCYKVDPDLTLRGLIRYGQLNPR